jgi:hypothetical protein
MPPHSNISKIETSEMQLLWPTPTREEVRQFQQLCKSHFSAILASGGDLPFDEDFLHSDEKATLVATAWVRWVYFHSYQKRQGMMAAHSEDVAILPT